jgi:hypothetical protein
MVDMGMLAELQREASGFGRRISAFFRFFFRNPPSRAFGGFWGTLMAE